MDIGFDCVTERQPGVNMKKYQWMMGVAMVLLMAQAGWAAAASSPFKISAQKKTVSKTKSETQQRPRGSTRLEETKVVYQFEIKNQSTEFSQQDLKVRWVVMVEKVNGRSFQAPGGETTTVLPFARAVTVETDPIPLSERTWQGAAGRRSGETGQVIKGYGLQIRTQDGELLMETYKPDSLKDEIQWEADATPDDSKRPVRPPRGNRKRGLKQ